MAEWDQRDQRWLFVNPQTGQRTFEHPHPTYQPQGGYGGGYPQQGGYPPQGGYGAGYPPQQPSYGGGYPPQQQPPKKDHKALEYGALGAVAGVAVGALAMHEGHKIRTFGCHPRSTSSGKLTDRLVLSP